MKTTIATILASMITFTSAKTEGFKQKINIEAQIYLTDTVGVVNPNNIIRLKPVDYVKMYLPDGTELVGLVTKTEDINREIYKVFGDIQNHPNAGFGFVLTKDGIFAGAVVFRDTDTTYKLEYSDEARGYIFIKSVPLKKIL